MLDTGSTNGLNHSAKVRIQLAVNGIVFNVAQLGPDFIVIRDPADHPRSIAELTMSIDGSLRHWPVDLVDGINMSQRKTRIVPILPHANGQASN